MLGKSDPGASCLTIFTNEVASVGVQPCNILGLTLADSPEFTEQFSAQNQQVIQSSRPRL